MAAREVAVRHWATVYAPSAAGESVANELAPRDRPRLVTGDGIILAGLVRVCTPVHFHLAVVKRETNSWRYPLLMTAYMFVLAYLASFATYRLSLWLGA